MAFKLSSKEEQTRQALIVELQEIRHKLDEELRGIEAEFENAVSGLSPLIDKYNEIAGRVNTFVEERAADFRNEFDEKSDNWKDSDRAENADSFVSDWENFTALETDVSTPDVPTIEIEDIDETPWESLESLPVEVDS
jgi:hypothetical protein